MLAAIRSSESAGVYQAAARGAELVAFSLLIVNFTIQPVISRLHTSGNLVELEHVVKGSARAVLTFSLPIAIVLVVWGGPVLDLVFGSEFRRGAMCLAILCVAHLANAVMGPADQLLNMTGHGRDTAVFMTIGAVANVLLNAAFIPVWDIEGAAAATGLSVVFYKAALAIRVRQRLGISGSILSVLSRN
jgi:O-antigen/teichoic acid export membrane protein